MHVVLIYMVVYSSGTNSSFGCHFHDKMPHSMTGHDREYSDKYKKLYITNLSSASISPLFDLRQIA